MEDWVHWLNYVPTLDLTLAAVPLDMLVVVSSTCTFFSILQLNDVASILHYHYLQVIISTIFNVLTSHHLPKII